jgi:hypothetical protein
MLAVYFKESYGYQRRGNRIDGRPNWKEQPTHPSLTGKCGDERHECLAFNGLFTGVKLNQLKSRIASSRTWTKSSSPAKRGFPR